MACTMQYDVKLSGWQYLLSIWSYTYMNDFSMQIKHNQVFHYSAILVLVHTFLLDEDAYVGAELR